MSDKEKTWKLNLNKSESIVINSDEHSEYFREISSHHVKVKLGFKSSHLESTACMNLTDMVNYNWPHVKSTENLIAVHQSGKYIAYGISIAGFGNKTASIRIHLVDSDNRHRLDELAYQIVDLAFVPSSDTEELMLAAIDLKGNVFIYVLYFLDNQFHFDKYLEVMASESSPVPYKLVWYGGDKESNIPRFLAVTRGKKIEIWNVDAMHTAHKAVASLNPLPLASVAEHILEMTQHSDHVTRVCFSVDGAAVATASLDGTIMFFQIIHLDEPGVPKELHSWQPHGGAPVTHMLLLDNYEEDVYWRFLVSFSQDNSVMKIWSCETWQCLQTFSFHGPSPVDSIRMIPYVDRYSKYIYLSDCHNKVFYVLELFSHTSRPIAFVYKFAAFLVISPILSVHVNSCERVPKLTHAPGSGLMLGGGDEDDTEQQYSDLRDRFHGISHLNRLRMYILQPKSLQDCVLVFPSLAVEPDPSRMVLVNASSDGEDLSPIVVDEEDDVILPPPLPTEQLNMQDASNPELVKQQLEKILATAPPPTTNQHLDLMTPDAFTSSTSLHSSPHAMHPTNNVMGSIPIVDVATLESKMKSKVASSSHSSANYRDVSSGSSPSREVEEIMHPYAENSENSKDKESKVPSVENMSWPNAPPIHKVKSDKKSPLVDTQTKKQRTYNGGPLFSAENHLDGPDPALETILIQLHKMELNIATLNNQVGATVSIVQQSQAALEAQALKLAALEQSLAAGGPQSRVEERMSQELLVSQITQAVNNIIADKLQSLVVTHFNSVVMPKLMQSMTTLKSHINTELSQKLTATDHLLSENLAKIVESKTVLNSVTCAVLTNLQPAMADCFKDFFRRSLGDYQRATQAMLKQLGETYEAGVKAVLQQYEAGRGQSQDCLGQIRGLTETLATAQRNFTGSLHSLETNINESLAKHLSSQKAVVEGAVRSAVQSRTVTPVPPAPSTVNKMQILQGEIKTFLMQNQFNAAFLHALTAQNLPLVLFVCEKVDPSKLFDMSPCPLEQHVIISLIQQLGGELENKSLLKCKYIDEALSAMDCTHSSTREHGPTILRSTLAKLKAFSSEHSTHPAHKNVKKLEHVIQGMLKDFD